MVFFRCLCLHKRQSFVKTQTTAEKNNKIVLKKIDKGALPPCCFYK